MVGPKPIETIYHGYRFRSRLEARWAVLFDALGIKYEYEKEGFDLGKLGYYLPDFYLPATGWFVEVKGDPSDINGIAKARELDACPPKYAMGCIIVSTPEYARYWHEKNGPPNWNDAFITFQLVTSDTGHINMAAYNRAVTKARMARFERGGGM